jgi:16S rRNA (cytosine1402-N4)-methyltransferase
MATFRHEPVLRDRVVELLSVVPAGLVVDATVGGGGHAAALLDAAPQIRLLGLDRDPDAVEAARAALERFGDRATVEHRRFDELAEAVRSHREVLGSDRSHDRRSDDTGVMGVLFDLGVSSPQLDRPERGFSFRQDGPLDMRMDPTAPRTAADVVNETSAEELAEVLRRYGDERYARRIAQAVVEQRPITTTRQLADVVAGAIPAPARRKSTGHPARRSFQAIRIEVNQELEVLADALDQAIAVLQPGGRCVAMSYHSGEDRLVKERFRRAVTGGCVCPPGLPCVCGAVPEARFVVRGAQKASADEIAANPRAESVRLRAIEAVPIERVS